MNKNFLSLFAAAFILIAGCQSKSQSTTEAAPTDSTGKVVANSETPGQKVDVSGIKVADAKTILARKQVPILCYHQVRNWKSTDGKVGKDYIVLDG